MTAVAADGTAVGEAAHSDCGKPMIAVGHGGRPPAHANAGGNPDGSGSDASGS